MATRKPRSPTIGAEINKLYRKREKIRKQTAALEALKEEYKDDEMRIRKRLTDEGLDNGRGTLATATVGTRDVASIEDYGRFEKYIYRTKSLDLLQSRPSITAIRERMKEGKTVPGIGITHLPTLNLRKRSK